MDNFTRFQEHLRKLSKFDPILVGSILEATTLFDSTEQKVEEIAAELSLKPVDDVHLDQPSTNSDITKSVPDAEERLKMEKENQIPEA